MVMDFQTFNKTGMDNLLLYVATINPYFIPLMLGSIFFICMLGTYFGTKRFSGQGDFWASAAAASYIMNIVVMFMGIKPGLVSLGVLASSVTIAIICTALLFFSRER